MSQPNNLTSLWSEINKTYLTSETPFINQFATELALNTSTRTCIQRRAAGYVKAVRANPDSLGGLNAFLQEYDLTSNEGVVLLCLAEALLRIPDTETIDKFIQDKLTKANWQSHLNHSQSLFVNAGTWGLMFTGKLFEQNDDTLYSIANKYLKQVTEPVVRSTLREAMKLLGQQYIVGDTIEHAIKLTSSNSSSKTKTPYLYSFDMLGEAAVCSADAERYFSLYQQAIESLAENSSASSWQNSNSISIKLSALHPRFEYTQQQRVFAELTPKLLTLANIAKQAGINLTIDAEESDRLTLMLQLFENVLGNKQLEGWNGFGLVVQTYQKRAPAVINWLIALAEYHQKKIPLRLVKGAYWDTEIKKAQEAGLSDYPVYTQKNHSDVAYLACAKIVLTANQSFYAQFATHNALTLAAVLTLAEELENTEFEMQRLQGMGDALYEHVLAQNKELTCRIYAPVGSHKDLLPYLVRRLLENGSNTSFVNRISDAKVPIEQVIQDPINHGEREQWLANKHIPVPADLFLPLRCNSYGVNLANDEERDNLIKSIEASHYSVDPISPVDEHTIKTILTTATGAMERWSELPVEHRAECLIRVANLIETNSAALVNLLVYEGKRCIPDALSEVREAVDFCRYYASIATKLLLEPQMLIGTTGESNSLTWHGRGVFVCISPWNFPLAIFCGQIAAALVTGNCVIAKPASATPKIAQRVTQLFYQAGISKEVLQLLVASPLQVNKLLLSDNNVSGVAFTGSLSTAQKINLTLAQREGAIAPLIAETGGINTMIVDSSALIEQVVIDAVRSAFNAAGQRCSALRVLYVQEDVAGRTIELLIGAMQQLTIGPAHKLSTDVGPLINQSAADSVIKHIEQMQTKAKVHYQIPIPDNLKHDTYVGPTLIEISHINKLEQEVFGPVLHVIRFGATELSKVITQINESKYGLTIGIQSRIQTTIDYITQHANVGNMYINRNMIGAVVGVQPFGGEGLSGTGPKAGGPHYLYRFAVERVTTTNTAAIGGNATLLMNSSTSKIQ